MNRHIYTPRQPWLNKIRLPWVPDFHDIQLKLAINYVLEVDLSNEDRHQNYLLSEASIEVSVAPERSPINFKRA